MASQQHSNNDEEMASTPPVPPNVEETADDDCIPNATHDDANGTVMLEHLEVLQVCSRDEGDDNDLVKPVRKNTDATTMTGSSNSSFLDEGSDVSDGNPMKDNSAKTPALDSLCEEDEDNADVEPESCCWRWFKRFLLFLVFAVVFLVATVMIGAEVERKSYSVKGGTNHYYTTPQMCAVHDPLTDTGITFPSIQEAHDADAAIVHCGDCGACSTARDMDIMARTKESLTRDSTKCAFKIFFGMRGVEKCMEERIGFTPACEDCWLDNIQCSFRSCKFSCIKYKLFSRQKNNKDDDDLNDCLKCDERSCGPGFIECAGANRRRMGIVSDIGREDIDQCGATDVDWNALPENNNDSNSNN